MRLGTTKSRAPSGVDFIRKGVSISMNPCSCKKFLAARLTEYRNSRFFFTTFLRRSRNLYFILTSSPPSVSSCMVKGGVADLFKTENERIFISISPVGKRRFLSLRSVTVPVAWITYSLPSGCSANNVFRSSPNSNCVIPYRSRRSMKVMLPNFLIV